MAQGRTLTEIIELVSTGKEEPGAALFPMVYDELLVMARSRMAQEQSGHTLQATALVHEAYAKLFAGTEPQWENRRHFFASAAEAMKRILIDHARAKKRIKRGGGEGKRLNLDFGNVADLSANAEFEEIVALNEAIERLEEERPRVAEVMKLRFYAGLSVREIADLMTVSPRTVNLDWAFARAWLFDQLRDSETE
jgi:RNA polymerase sigma factor (TIGR02999 family)